MAIQSFGRVAIPVATVSSIGRVVVSYNTPEQEATLAGYIAKGQAVTASNATIMATRALDPSPMFKRGFDAATGFCQGMTVNGPGQQAVKALVTGSRGMTSADTELAKRGFDVGQALQHGISRSQGLPVPGEFDKAAGFLVTTGVAGNNMSSDVKGGIMTTLTGNTGTKAGAVAAIQHHQGLWARFRAFFGL